MRSTVVTLLVLGTLGATARARAQDDDAPQQSDTETIPAATPRTPPPPPPVDTETAGEAPAPRPTIRPEDLPPLPPRTLLPSFLPMRLPHREVGLAFGVSRFSGTDDEPFGSITSISGALYLETMAQSQRFGLRMQLPAASAGSAMVGDLDMEFAFLAWSERDGRDAANLLAISLDFTIPTALLNTLGGGNGKIHPRRIDNYRTISDYNMLPIRYLQMMPHVSFMRRQGRFAFFADLGGMLILACNYSNYYEAPHVEAALQYGAGASVEVFASPDQHQRLGLGLELSGTTFLTHTTVRDADPALLPSEDARVARATGLSVAPAVHAFFANRIALDLGTAIALVNDETWTRYTPSTLWRHDWTFFLQAGIQF